MYTANKLILSVLNFKFLPCITTGYHFY